MLRSAASASGSMPVWPAAGPAASPSAATSARAALRIRARTNLNLPIVVSMARHRTGGDGGSWWTNPAVCDAELSWNWRFLCAACALFTRRPRSDAGVRSRACGRPIHCLHDRPQVGDAAAVQRLEALLSQHVRGVAGPPSGHAEGDDRPVPRQPLELLGRRRREMWVAPGNEKSALLVRTSESVRTSTIRAPRARASRSCSCDAEVGVDPASSQIPGSEDPPGQGDAHRPRPATSRQRSCASSTSSSLRLSQPSRPRLQFGRSGKLRGGGLLPLLLDQFLAPPARGTPARPTSRTSKSRWM